MEPIDFLAQRLSVPARQLGGPGPDAAQTERLLEVALRVPDHGRLTPWRLLRIDGEWRARLGERLAEIHRRNDPQAPEAVLDKDRHRFDAAPLIVVVIARIDAAHPKIPAQEQLLSAGCVAYNLLLGAQALGFGAQWLTGWAAYDVDAAALLGLAPDERIVGFVHVGSVREPAVERPRPEAASRISDWQG